MLTFLSLLIPISSRVWQKMNFMVNLANRVFFVLMIALQCMLDETSDHTMLGLDDAIVC